MTAFREAFDKTVSLGQRLDLVFNIIRLGTTLLVSLVTPAHFIALCTGLFFNDEDLISRNISKAESLMEEGGDWDRRNRLKVHPSRGVAWVLYAPIRARMQVYVGINSIRRRDLTTAAKLLFESVATFTCSELMPYPTFVKHAVYVGLIAFDRHDLKKKVGDGSRSLCVTCWRCGD